MRMCAQRILSRYTCDVQTGSCYTPPESLEEDGGGMLEEDGGGTLEKDGGGMLEEDGGGAFCNDGTWCQHQCCKTISGWGCCPLKVISVTKYCCPSSVTSACS